MAGEGQDLMPDVPNLLEHGAFGFDEQLARAIRLRQPLVQGSHVSYDLFRPVLERTFRAQGFTGAALAGKTTTWIGVTSLLQNLGSFAGRPATGRTMRTEVFDVCRFENGVMVEHWAVPDQLGAMMQLGHIPS